MIDPSEEDKVVVRTCLDLPHGCVVVQLQGGCECRADSANSGTCSHSPTRAATTLNMDGLCMKWTICYKRDMTRAEWVSTTWLGWKACEGLRVECGLFMAPRLLMLPLLLLLVNVVVDAALGKQHFLVEPEDKVASRGARVSGLFVSCNSLIVVGLREHLFWCQNCQHLPLRAVLDGAEVKKLAKQFFITVFSCNICIISHHSITSVVHTVWILWQFVNGGNLF